MQNRCSLTAHRNSSPRTSIWPYDFDFLSYIHNHGSLQDLQGKIIWSLKCWWSGFICQFNPLNLWTWMHCEGRRCWSEGTTSDLMSVEKQLLSHWDYWSLSETSLPGSGAHAACLDARILKHYALIQKKRQDWGGRYYTSNFSRTAPSGCVGVKASMRQSDPFQV